jgi:hypothetical protein
MVKHYIGDNKVSPKSEVYVRIEKQIMSLRISYDHYVSKTDSNGKELRKYLHVFNENHSSILL